MYLKIKLWFFTYHTLFVLWMWISQIMKRGFLLYFSSSWTVLDDKMAENEGGSES